MLDLMLVYLINFSSTRTLGGQSPTQYFSKYYLISYIHLKAFYPVQGGKLYVPAKAGQTIGEPNKKFESIKHSCTRSHTNEPPFFLKTVTMKNIVLL